MRTPEGPGLAGAEAQAERIASILFLASRSGQLLFSALMVAGDRRRYSRPVLQIAVLGAVAVESGWLGRRVVKARRYDDRLGPWVDTACAAAAVLVSHRGQGSESTALWAKNIAIGAAIGTAGTRRAADSVGMVATLCSAAIATGVRAQGRDSHVAGMALAVNDAVNWAGCHIAARTYVQAHRRYGRLRDEADALAVERASATAAEAERGRQHERLHRVTIGVLDRIAHSESVQAAVSVARAEAARLRYALRTGGDVPAGLDQALADVADAMSGQGMKVELVTAELMPAEDPAHPSPEAVAGISAAVLAALRVANDLGAAQRATVRAVGSGDAVSLTVRDHGRGFDDASESGARYAARFAQIRTLMAPIGGQLAVSSEPGNGVRLTLTVATGDRGVPPSRRDISGVSVPSPAESAVGRTAQFRDLPATDTRRADRPLLTALLAWRLTGFVTGAAALVAGRERYRRPGVAQLQLAAAVGESVWYSRRVLLGDRWSDSVAARVDAVAAVAVLALGHANLAPSDRSTWINWAPWTFAANVICGQAMGVEGVSQAGVGAAAVIGTYALQAARPVEAAANSAALASFFAVSLLFAAQIRDSALRLEHARSEAVREGRALAEVRARSAALRLLHDDALQTLETLAVGRFDDLASVQRRAREEAADLDRTVNRQSTSAQSLAARLQEVVDGHAARGLTVDFEPGLPAERPDLVTPALREAICGAANEALTNAGKHARASRISVSLGVTDRSGIVVTIADDGVGFDPATARGGFGMGESIQRRMSDAGGRARIESVVDEGTRVTLSGPA